MADLARAKNLAAFYDDKTHKITIVAVGTKPTPCHRVWLEALMSIPEKPRTYRLLWEQEPRVCSEVMTPYQVSQDFAGPSSRPEHVIVETKGGSVQVPVLGALKTTTSIGASHGVAEPEQPKPREVDVEGSSEVYSFDEAVQSALAKVPDTVTHADELTELKVVEIGVRMGGFAGFRHLYVRLKGQIT